MFYIETYTVGVRLFFPIACVANSNLCFSKTSKTALEVDYIKYYVVKGNMKQTE